MALGWVPAHAAPILPKLGRSAWLYLGGIIPSIMRGNMFLRYFGEGRMWQCCPHMGFCDGACQWRCEDGMFQYQPHRYWGLL